MGIRFSYTQEQLDAAVLAERRRCADICEGLRKDMVNAFAGRDTEDYADGYVDGCNECQWAILETPEK